MSPAATPQPFFSAPEQRVALARERFFDDGPRPTGLVSEAVIQSWSRCRGARRDPRWALAFDPVSRSSLEATLERNRSLLLAAQPQIAQLEAAIAGTATRVLLTDAQGVIVHASACENAVEQPVMQRVARRGVSLAEQVVGTNAPAVVIKTGAAVTVLGAEHYHDCVATLRCAAAPIHDARGQLAGVLDLTVEARPFAFDAAALVGVYATTIGNRLLESAAGEHQVLAFQVSPELIGSPLQALVGLSGDGCIAWCNQAARQLLGLGDGGAGTPAEVVLGLDVQALAARWHGRHGALQPLVLPNGLAVWMRLRGPGQTWDTTPPLSTATVRPAAAAASLSGMTRELIDRTLAECDGNVARAARKLGVSRGLLYRRRSGAGGS